MNLTLDAFYTGSSGHGLAKWEYKQTCVVYSCKNELIEMHRKSIYCKEHSNKGTFLYNILLPNIYGGSRKIGYGKLRDALSRTRIYDNESRIDDAICVSLKNDYKICKLARTHEQELHGKLSKYRIHHEVFYNVPEVSEIFNNYKSYMVVTTPV